MSLSLNDFNSLPRYRAETELLKCCRSRAWARSMANRRPFANLDRLLKAASEIWWRLDAVDWAQIVGTHYSEQQIRTAAEQQDKLTCWCLARLFLP
jgi:hypothetical protein